MEVVQETAVQFVIRYRFNNRSDRNSYVFNRLYSGIDEKGVFQVDPNRIYVQLERGAAILCKQIIPVPDEVDVECPVVPCATLVRPREVTEEVISVGLPVFLQTPYTGFRVSALRDTQEGFPVNFQLGFFLVQPEQDALAIPVETSTGRAFRFRAAPPARQTILSAGPLGIIPVWVPK